jgi:hypothetical protein
MRHTCVSSEERREGLCQRYHPDHVHLQHPPQLVQVHQLHCQASTSTAVERYSLGIMWPSSFGMHA